MAGPGIIAFTRTEKYSSDMAEELMQMREERVFSDFKITVEKADFPCHRLILAVNSPVLKAMMQTEMVEASKKQVTVDHIKPKIMEVVLDYMYSGQVSFHKDQLMEMVKTTNYLQIMKLKDMCVDQVPTVLGPENVISWSKLGNQLDLAEVASNCSKMMVSCFAEISQQQDFLVMDFVEVQAYFNEVVGSDTDRNKVLLAVMRWVSNDTANRHTHLETLLCQVQLDNCSLQVLLDVQETYATIIGPNINAFVKLTKALKQIATPKPTQVLTIIGGQIVSNVNLVCWRLNKAKRFIEDCKIPFDALAKWHSVCEIPLGFAITGGENSDLCIMFTAAMKSWSSLKNLLTKRSSHGSICISKVLFVFGGGLAGNTDGSSKSVDYLALEDGTWKSGPDIPVDVRYPKVAEITGSAYLLDEETRQLNQLDVTTSMEGKVWNKRASLPGDGDCEGVSMISMNHQLCVAGGRGRMTAWYSPATDTWSIGQQTIQEHWYGPLVFHDNVLFLLGGSYKTTHGANDIEQLSMENGSWAVSDMKMPEKLMLQHALVLYIPQDDD